MHTIESGTQRRGIKLLFFVTLLIFFDTSMAEGAAGTTRINITITPATAALIRAYRDGNAASQVALNRSVRKHFEHYQRADQHALSDKVINNAVIFDGRSGRLSSDRNASLNNAFSGDIMTIISF